jgi:CheY-like chemotaxis protein
MPDNGEMHNVRHPALVIVPRPPCENVRSDFARVVPSQVAPVTGAAASYQRPAFQCYCVRVNCSDKWFLRAVGMAAILVVEDEEHVRVLAESYLREQGHETFSAATRDQALAVLEGAKIDLLFVDIGLYEQREVGLELAKEAVERNPELKVLYTTGQPVTDGMKALFVENSGLLTKPYTVDQLQTILVVKLNIKPLNAPKVSPLQS